MTIQILPARLANQIAAGEVVERPASVVKELVENSLDAGATRIEVDIEKGGSKLIRVQDNGSGISKDELTLALSRHATSKITCLDDLEAIMSLGFRGEALASISSVSRLTLTSRTQQQAEAWSAFAEGRDMGVKLKPAAHPVGSTVEVIDLFFNTPARRKFLRTDKTEFTHIDELLKRVALSRFDVSITLKHNGVMVRQYRAARSDAQQLKRLAAICGNSFAKDAVAIKLQHDALQLSGWICTPQGARAQNDIQHCFVNKRMMRDKLINHAIRQGYEASLAAEQFAAFVLYIDIAPQQVDVNVHPAKHEVRFHQARLVHDCIYQTIRDALAQVAADEPDEHQSPAVGLSSTIQDTHSSHWQPSLQPRQPSSKTSNSYASQYSGASAAAQPPTQLYQQLLTPHVDFVPASAPLEELALQEPSVGLGKALSVVEQRFLLLQDGEALQLLDLALASYLLMLRKLKDANGDGLKSQPLLIPQRLRLNAQEYQLIAEHSALLHQFGINFQQKNNQQMLIMSVCQPLREVDLQNFFNKLLIFMASNTKPDNMNVENMSAWLATELMVKSDKFSLSQAIGLISELEACWQHELVAHYPKLIRKVDLTPVVNSFEHD